MLFYQKTKRLSVSRAMNMAILLQSVFMDHRKLVKRRPISFHRQAERSFNQRDSTYSADRYGQRLNFILKKEGIQHVKITTGALGAMVRLRELMAPLFLY